MVVLVKACLKNYEIMESWVNLFFQFQMLITKIHVEAKEFVCSEHKK